MTMLEIPLDVPDVMIRECDVSDPTTIRITVASTILGTHCRKCGQWITRYYDTDKPIELRHLPILGRKTIIRICPVRYRCTACHRRPTTTQRLPWSTLRAGHTEAYDAYVLQQIVNSTVEDVSQREQVGYDAVMGTIRRQIATEINWDEITEVTVLGVDEISLKKGHKDFVTIVTGQCQDGLRILGVLQDRKKATVKAFFQQVPTRLHAQLVAVCTDLYDGFVQAAREVFGATKVVADRFHVAKLYRKTLEQVRKQEMRRLKEALPKAEYAKLKGVMWSLRKTPQPLTTTEHQQLRLLFQHAPLVRTVYDLCQDLTDIFDTPTRSVTEARHTITAWIERVKQTGVQAFKTFLATLETHWQEITNYFLNRHTSGFVEGLNNKIKVLKRRCYGILKPCHLFQRITLDLAGYSANAGKL
ncbi:MAG: ISL3 family transposase [bacterium]|nr:ISL3 family transposase [bacterium]